MRISTVYLLTMVLLLGNSFGQSKNPIGSGPLPDGKKILQKAADALRRVKTIEYTEVQDHMDHKDTIPFLRATVRQSRADVAEMGFVPGRFIVEGNKAIKDQQRVEFAYSYDGRAFRILEPAEKLIKVLRSPTPYIAGQTLGDIGAVGISAFSQPEPFRMFLDQGEDFVYEGKRMINGVECDVITFALVIDHPALGRRKVPSRWFIGREDGLPRGNEVSNVLKTIKILKLNDDHRPSDYYIPVLNGFSERLITGNESKVDGLLPVAANAPDWTLLDPQGRKHSLSDYRGKIVLLDFWGTWCVPCWKTMPVIQSLHESYMERGVVIFGISVVDKEGDPVGFMKNKGYTYGLLLNGDDVSEMYKAFQLPTLYVVGPDGKIVHAEHGFRQTAKEDLKRIIDQLLAVQKK